MRLRGKQKRYLRSQANQMRPRFSIGKQGINQQWLQEIIKVLNRRELVKVRVLANAPVSVKEAQTVIDRNPSIQVVQKIGKTLLLFKVSDQAKHRKISQIVQNI